MVDRPFNTSSHGQFLNMGGKVYRPTVATLGESHGTSYLAAAIQYGCWRDYHADIVFDTRTYANGGQMFAVGGTQINTGANSLLGTQIGQFALRPADIAFIASGYNDAPTSQALAATNVTDILTAADALFAAGAKAVIIMGQTPRGIANNAPHSMSMDRMLQAACHKSKDSPYRRMFFCPIGDILNDPTATPNTGYYGAANTFGSMTGDGTHWSGRSIRAIGRRVNEILCELAPEKLPSINHLTGTYDPANAPYGNLLGNAGSMIGTAGLLNYGLDTGVAGVDAASRVSIVGSGPTVTPSIDTGGANGGRRQVIAPSAAGGNVFIDIAATVSNFNNSDTTRRYMREAIVELDAVTGLSDIWMYGSGDGTYTAWNTISMGDTNAAAGWDDATTETLFVYTTMPVAASGNNPFGGLNFSFFKTPSGNIRVSKLGMFLIP